MAQGSSLMAPDYLQTHLYREKTNEHIILKKTPFFVFATCTLVLKNILVNDV